MNVKRFLATIIVLFLAAVAATQVFTVKAATTRNFTLYGSYASGDSYTQGWGFTAANITSPGPTIVVEQGDNVSLTLISIDGITHSFFVSYTNASSPGTGDPWSDDFGGKAVNFQFLATNTVGTYKYHCYYHPGPMWGYFKVVPTGTIPEFQPLIMLTLLVAGTIVAVLAYKRKPKIQLAIILSFFCVYTRLWRAGDCFPLFVINARKLYTHESKHVLRQKAIQKSELLMNSHSRANA